MKNNAPPETARLVLVTGLSGSGKSIAANAFEDLGYNVETHGQKSYNGVALLSKHPLSDIRRGLPGDETDEQARWIEARMPSTACTSGSSEAWTRPWPR